MRMVEVVEQGEEVEQQLHVAGPIEEIAEEMVIPTDREVEEAEANTKEPGAEGVVTMEAEQPLLTAGEVERRLATTMSEAERMELDMATQEFEKGKVINESENPTEKVGTSQAEGIATSNTAPDHREVVVVTDEDDETEKMSPSDEAVQPEVAAVRTYQRRPAREETSGKRSEEEPSRETPRQRAGENVDSPARSAVGIPRRRRRLLIDEEPEEQEDVFFTPIDEQPSAGQPDTPAEIEEREEEKRKRKRKGKAIATPVKKSEKEVKASLNSLGDSRRETKGREKRCRGR